MRDLEWFIDEGPEYARLGHYTWKESALTLNHIRNGHTATQMRRLDGMVFPGVDYPGLVTPGVILICPKQVPGITNPARGGRARVNGQLVDREDDREGNNDWHFTLRSLFTTYYERRYRAQELANLSIMPDWTTTVHRRHLIMVAGPDGTAGEVRGGVVPQRA